MAKIGLRKAVIVFTLIATILTSVLCISALSDYPTVKSEVSFFKVVLDAGHGGVDGGSEGTITGVKEKELNLKVVKKLGEYFKNANFSVVLTRDSDAGLYGTAKENLKRQDMLKRKEIIEQANPALVISVHMNKYVGAYRRGAQVFYKKGDEQGRTVAEYVQTYFNEIDSLTKDYSPLTGDYYILNVSPCPAIIAECGFLSNKEDEALLLTDEYQDKLAYAIFKGSVKYLSGLTESGAIN